MSTSARTPLMFAIIGHPVAHALSPVMHNTAFRVLGLPHRYSAIDLTGPDLPEGIRRLRSERYAGLNVTMPHKSAIIPLLDEISGPALAIGAVNTVVAVDGRWRGFNTDVIGFAASLGGLALELRGKSAVVLGSGGGARAVVHALGQMIGMSAITVAARSRDRAEALIRDYGTTDVSLQTIPFDGPSLPSAVERSALLVNCTPVGMLPDDGETPLVVSRGFHPELIVYDLIYRPMKTRLLRESESAGCRTIDGIEMLIHQGAAAFKLWTGEDMPLDPVRQQILDVLKPQP